MSQLQHISTVAPKPKFKQGDWVRVLPSSKLNGWMENKMIGAIGQVINDGLLYPEVQFPKRYNVVPLYFDNSELMFLHPGTVELISEKWGIPRGLK